MAEKEKDEAAVTEDVAEAEAVEEAPVEEAPARKSATKKSEPEKVSEETEPEPVQEAVPSFTIDELMPHSEHLFGVGGHVLVGAVTAGVFQGKARVTKEEAQAGIDTYMNMPVEGKET